MPVVTYVDPISIHDPTSGGVAPATWFTTIEADLRSITGRLSARIYQGTTEDLADPGPTTATLGSTDWNNGMTVGSNAITVPASYAGKYLVVGCIRLATVGAGVNVMAISVNGTDTYQETVNRTGGGFLNTMALSTTISLAVADVLSIRVTSNASDTDTEVSTTPVSLAAFWLSA